MGNEKLCILLVEDDPNDVFFLQHAFEQVGITNPMQVVTEGKDAIDYLGGAGKFGDREAFPFPFLMLLDLKLPSVPGTDVLKWIGKQRNLPNLLSVVLTSSQHQQDVEECYRLGACGFLVKPLSTAERLRLARAIKEFWIELNVPPVPRKSDPEG